MNSLFISSDNLNNNGLIYIAHSSFHNCNVQVNNLNYIEFDAYNQFENSEMQLQSSVIFLRQNNNLALQLFKILHFYFKAVTLLAVILMTLQVELYFFNHLNFTS